MATDIEALVKQITTQVEATEKSTVALVQIHEVLIRIEKRLNSQTFSLIKALLVIIGFLVVALVALVNVKLPLLSIP